MASSKTCTSSSPLVTLAMSFPLFSFMVANPILKRTKLVIYIYIYIYIKEEEMDDTYFDKWSPLE